VRFTKAVRYAQVQMADPVFGEKYRLAAKAKGTSVPNNLAVQDYLRSPVIENLEVEAYHGEIGDEIIIDAFDDLEVEKVAVEIYPNPVANELHIDLSNFKGQELSIALYSLTGSLIFNETHKNLGEDVRIGKSLQYLGSGMYLLVIDMDGVRKTYKIVKE
jgi:hypothetical protein